MFLLIFAIIFVPELAIFAFIVLIFYILECAFFLKSLLKEEGASTKKSVDVIGVFSRPETITEEEVSISKEKKICLVCKGKVAGDIYLCTECEAFYCSKCSEALKNLENACWACDTPIDKSKPVKSLEKKEEIVVEEGSTK